MVRTDAGTVARRLVRDFPRHTFVLEDLDLTGCRGSMRFAYKAVGRALEARAATERRNPAYTSQECPSCGYVNRRNRHGTSFRCLSCGRISHADVIGAVNLLGRSGDEQVTCETGTKAVKSILRERYLARRNGRARDSSGGRSPPRREPSARMPTVTPVAMESPAGRMASNLVVE
jgi:transposase